MNKELFIEAIEAIQKQVQLDIEVSKHLGKAFPDAFEANLLPKNHFLQNALIHVLQVEMNDLQLCEHGQSWIEYFLWELNFGEENYRLKVTQNGKEIKMSNAAELYDFLNYRLRLKVAEVRDLTAQRYQITRMILKCSILT